MRKFPGRSAALAAVIVAGLAVPALAATSASAATTGHDGGFRPQVFIIHQEGVNSTTADVTAFGPIQGRGLDVVKSDTRDLFAFRKGSVYVNHKATSDSKPKFDFRACTATIYENGTWRLDPPGTGKYEKARGRGQYAATIVLGFARHHGHGDAAAADGGRHHRCHIDLNKQPKTQTVDVIATGKVSLGHHHDRK